MKLWKDPKTGKQYLSNLKLTTSMTLPAMKSSEESHRDMKANTTKTAAKPPTASALKAKKDALMKGERAPSRVFRIEQNSDGTFSRVAVNPESQRRRTAKAWEAKSSEIISECLEPGWSGEHSDPIYSE